MIIDMLNSYSPFGDVRTVLTSLHPGIGFDGYQGSATALSLDHVLRRLIDLPALPSGLDKDIYGGGTDLTLEDSVLTSLDEAIERMIGAFSSLRYRWTPLSAGHRRMNLSALERDSSGLMTYNYSHQSNLRTQTFCVRHGIKMQGSCGSGAQICSTGIRSMSLHNLSTCFTSANSPVQVRRRRSSPPGSLPS